MLSVNLLFMLVAAAMGLAALSVVLLLILAIIDYRKEVLW